MNKNFFCLKPAGEIITRAKVSESKRKIAPEKNDKGINFLLSAPITNLTICGIIKPTKAITPVYATDTLVIIEPNISIKFLENWTLIPNELPWSSPNINKFKSLEKIIASVVGISIIGTIIFKLIHRAESKPPASQNIICLCDSISPEKIIIAEVIELRKAPIAIPDNIKVGTEIFPDKVETVKTNNNDIKEPKNANIGTIHTDKTAIPVKIAKTAPVAPPADIPIIPGSAKLFLKIPCIITPETDNPPPITNAINILGNLTVSRIAVCVIVMDWESKPNKLRK